MRYPLSYRQVEDILYERGIDICHETVRFWVGRFGLKFASEIRKKRAGHHSNWQWHLDEVFVKVNCERFYLWRAVDHEGEVLECYVSKRRDRHAAKKFLLKTIRKHGSPKIITTDKLATYRAVFRKKVLQNDSCAVVERTTDVKTHTCHFDDENGRCKSSKAARRCKFLRRYTAKFIIISITKDISKSDKLISKNAAPLFRSGSKFALHCDLELWCLRTS